MFSEDRYFTDYKKLRNQFRKYRYLDLLEGCFEYLHASVDSKVDYIKRAPWLVLLFAKWLLLDDNYPNKSGKAASNDDVMRLLQYGYDLTNRLRMPSDYDHYTLFLRSTAYQQFPYQFDFGYRHLSRQSIMFADLQDNHLIKKQFKKLTGVGVNDFIDLSWILVSYFLVGQRSHLPYEWFSVFKDNYSEEVVNNFLKVVSISIYDARKVLKEKDSGRRLSIEHHELTPFINFPLLRVNNGFLMTEKHIVYRCVEHYIYDRLRQWDAEKFMGKFGGIFERYAEKAIHYAGLKYTTEEEIRNILGETGNQIDFIIHEDDANIFLDTKGVEMNYQGRVTHSTSFLKDRTEASILKSIRQAHDVIRKQNENHECKITLKGNNYLFVVTYKELYLGNGSNYYEIIAKEKIDEIYENYKSYPVIPPENMYFITIDDLDFVCQMLQSGKITISKIIERAKMSDKEPDTKKFDFTQHLHEMPVRMELPSYLIERKNEMFEKLESMRDK